jgi:hypothetical protein
MKNSFFKEHNFVFTLLVIWAVCLTIIPKAACILAEVCWDYPNIQESYNAGLDFGVTGAFLLTISVLCKKFF